MCYYCYYFKFYYFNGVCLPECNVCQCQKGVEGIESPWTWSGFGGLNSGLLEDQQVPLTTGLFLSLTLLVSVLVCTYVLHCAFLLSLLNLA